MVNVNGESASLTLRDIIIDGKNMSGAFERAICVINGATLILKDGAIVRNNTKDGVSVDGGTF